MKGMYGLGRGDEGRGQVEAAEGEVRVYLGGNGGRGTRTRRGPNRVLGEMAVCDEQPRSAGAEATVDTTVRVRRRDRLLAIVHEHPEVMLEFVKNLSQRLREMDAQLQRTSDGDVSPSRVT